MTANPRVILGLMVMVIIIGSWALWRFSVWSDDRARRADEEWHRAFEPTGDGKGVVVHPEDVLTEPPVHPSEYEGLR